MPLPKAVAFDMFETVVSLEPLRPRIEALGLPGSALELLYASALRDAFALAAVGQYQPFKTVIQSVLGDLLARQGFDPNKDASAFFETMQTLPPHPDAREAFEILRDAGVRVFTLSNGAASVTRRQLELGGLAPYVERVVSVDEAGFSKPRREAYLKLAEVAEAAPNDICLVATHPWDLNGAKAAGLLTAYVARGRPYPAFLTPPDVSGETLADLARTLVSG